MNIGGIQNGLAINSVQVCKGDALVGDHWYYGGWSWSDATSFPFMTHARGSPNAVILPNARVVVFGGEGLPDPLTSNPTHVKIPEMYEGTWKQMAQQSSPRAYHSATVLLPSGNVFYGGGEVRTSDYEIFRPPYNACGMLKPVVTGLSHSAITYQGGPYTITFNPLMGVSNADVVLMRPASVTHHFDFGQRYHKVVTANPTSTSIQFGGPPNARWVQRGWHMLFLVTNVGGVSEAQWVHVL
jgi:galactose oxidase